MYEDCYPDKNITPQPSSTTFFGNNNNNNNNRQRGIMRRGRAKSRSSQHVYSGSHSINLNIANQAIKERAKSRPARPTHGQRNRSEFNLNLKGDKFHKIKPQSCTNKQVKQRVNNKQNKNKNKNDNNNHNKNRRSKGRVKPMKKNQRTITSKYDTFSKYYTSPKELSPSPSPMAPTLKLVFEDEKSDLGDDDTTSLLSVSSICSSTSYATDSDIEFLGFSPILKNKQDFDKPEVKIIYSPRINEAVFVGYTPAPQPTYKFRGKGKINDKDIIPEPSPSPESAKFTFINIKSKYLPHKIKWTSKTGFTDSEIDDDVYADNPPFFTFSDNDNKSDTYDSDDDDNPHKSQKSIKIDQLLSNLLGSDNDSSSSEEMIAPKPASSKLIIPPNAKKSKIRSKSKPAKKKKKNFKIVIDEIKHDENGDDIYFGSVSADESTPPTNNKNNNNNNDNSNNDNDETNNDHIKLSFTNSCSDKSENSDDDAGELLFDFGSFVNNLKARSNND